MRVTKNCGAHKLFCCANGTAKQGNLDVEQKEGNHLHEFRTKNSAKSVYVVTLGCNNSCSTVTTSSVTPSTEVSEWCGEETLRKRQILGSPRKLNMWNEKTRTAVNCSSNCEISSSSVFLERILIVWASIKCTQTKFVLKGVEFHFWDNYFIVQLFIKGSEQKSR